MAKAVKLLVLNKVVNRTAQGKWKVEYCRFLWLGVPYSLKDSKMGNHSTAPFGGRCTMVVMHVRWSNLACFCPYHVTSLDPGILSQGEIEAEKISGGVRKRINWERWSDSREMKQGSRQWFGQVSGGIESSLCGAGFKVQFFVVPPGRVRRK